MTDLLTRLTTCTRPKLLIRAARIGSHDYARKTALYRLLGVDYVIGHAPALRAFMDLEEELDTLRRAHDATYSVARHVEVLVAVMGEAHLLGTARALQAPQAPPEPKAPEAPNAPEATQPTKPADPTDAGQTAALADPAPARRLTLV